MIKVVVVMMMLTSVCRAVPINAGPRWPPVVHHQQLGSRIQLPFPLSAK
jgi:hypothetical protein